MILATLRDLAASLRCRPDQAEDVVRSEQSARVRLSRRGVLLGSGAVATGSAFGFGSMLAPFGYLGAMYFYSESFGSGQRGAIGSMRLPVYHGAPIQLPTDPRGEFHWTFALQSFDGRAHTVCMGSDNTVQVWTAP